ncbi:MAG: hypothetical protein A2X08_01415 [Bacteroidetes bacterium GWA2_32_17]|nr:MAG: hypothetical protein A2X08_01415 [Bacteroidetes bacterium GWA2_32_17]
MQQISLIDETFNLLNSEHYKITLQILFDSFSFTIFDSVRKKHILLNHYQLENSENFNDVLKPLISDNEILKSNFDDFRIFVFTNNIVIIPSSFSNQDKNNDYANFNFNENNSKSFFCKSSFDTIINYSISKEINDLLATIKYKTLYPHAISILKEAQIVSLQKNIINSLFVCVLHKFIEIVAIKNNELQLFNVFQYQNDDDFCYYLNYLFELFKFDKEKVPIIFSGITKKNDSRISKAEQFFKKIQYSKSNTQYIYSYRFNEIPQHHFSNLFIMPYEDNKRY